MQPHGGEQGSTARASGVATRQEAQALTWHNVGAAHRDLHRPIWVVEEVAGAATQLQARQTESPTVSSLCGEGRLGSDVE